MKINILTPYRKGGPYYWGKNLSNELNKIEDINARHIHNILKLIFSPFFQNCDIVHTTIPIFFKLWDKPLVLTIHGDYRKEKNFWSKFYPLSIKKANIVTVPSKFLKRELGLDNAIIIPNAIDYSYFEDVVCYSNLKKDYFNFISITNFNFLEKTRGIDTLVHILDRFYLKFQRFHINIVGGGKYLMQYKRKYCNRKYLTFLGYSSNIKEILSKSNIFLYYSYHDNFPIVILEAMACGLPVISNNVGAMGEIISNCEDGFISDNPTDFERILLSLVNNPNLILKIGKASKNKIERDFNLTNLNRFIEVYNNET